MNAQRFTARALWPVALVAALLAIPTTAQATPAAAGARPDSGIFAAERTPLHLGASSAKTQASTSVGGSLVKTILALLVVIAVIYGVAWVLRRMRRSSETRASGSGLASVATLPLGGGRALHLVRAGSDLVLVGASEHGVSAIRSYSEADARAAGLLGDVPATELGALLPPAAATEWRPATDWQERPRAASRPGTIGHALESLRRLTVRS
jgi:flagellar protein FliO/FliZ